ncbi:MAG: serine/threonine-protein kinase PknK [Bradymonadaceae bacterium]|nr:serine/threonine-protein kinase PknK [Lujinxingiaceae bacterium]
MSTNSWNTDLNKGVKVFAGRYAYQKPLGRGAGGSVYLAEDLLHKRREVALKVLSAEAYQTVQGKMLRREFEILSKLDHPNLVRVFDYGSLPDGGVYLAEEYIDGFSLQDARALLEPVALINLTIQLLQGLAYLHAMGTIHRDIKPANVMLLWLDDASALPMAKLVDFGLSSMDPKRDTLRGGTRSYMAPEVIRGEKGEQRSDLYSLGVTLYYALCGVLPFGPRSKDDPPPTDEDFRPPEPHRLNPEVPLPLSRFTMALLRQLPDVEYADAGEALQALAADAETFEAMSAGRMANSLDVAASPVLKGYFERGILERREREADALVEWLGREGASHVGQVNLISGTPGSGRSRLLHDVESASKLGGHLVLRVNCRAPMAPFELMSELLRQTIAVARSHQADALAKHRVPAAVRACLTALELATAGEGAEPQVEQAWMRTAFEEAVALLAPYRLVLFIDDIDQGDEHSMAFLRNWYERAKSSHRPDIIAAAVAGKALSGLESSPATQHLVIEGITRADVDAFFVDKLMLANTSESWRSEVARFGQGRPSYIEELCRHLIDVGVLRRASAQAWEADLTDLGVVPMPTSIKESFRRRMTAVGAGGRECLELLALLDRPVLWESIRELLVVGGTTPEEADRTLDTLQWRHLTLTELETSGRLVRLIAVELSDVVRDMLSPEWKRALHRRIGNHLIASWRKGDADPCEAARHLELGGQRVPAHDVLEVAGDDASMRSNNYRQALSFYDKALVDNRDGRASAILHVKIAQAAVALYDPARVRHHLAQAGVLAERTALDWLMYRVFLSAARIAICVGDTAWAHEWQNRLRDCLPAMSQQGEVLELDARLALSQGSLDLATSGLQRCIKRARHFGNRAGLVVALRHYAHLRLLGGHVAEGFEFYNEAIEVASPLGATSLGAVLASYGGDLRRVGRVNEAIEALVDAIEMLREGDEPEEWIRGLLELANCHADRGDLSEARKRGVEASCFAQRLNHRPLEQKIALFLGSLVLRGRGDASKALDSVALVIASFSKREDFALDRAEALIALGSVAVGAGLTEHGQIWLDDGVRLADSIGARLFVQRTGS